MALTVSLRRVLLMLLTTTIFVVMVLYWNQNTIRPQTYVNNFERSARNHPDWINVPIPTEKIWTYKCEGDKCVRYHFFANNKKGEKRIPFMTCSMTCGGINIWPHPTIKAAVSSKSLTFSMEDIQLDVDTPFKAVRTHFEESFLLFLKDLRHIQRLQSSNSKSDNGDKSNNDDDVFGEKTTTDNHVELIHPRHRQRRRRQDNTQNWVGSHIGAHENLAVLGNIYSSRSQHESDIALLKINVSIKKFPELDLNLETDESYQLTISTEKAHLKAQIIANSFFGARHGLSTLQQLIWYDDEVNLLRIISKAIIVDAPRFRYRGLMLDTSRHFFSIIAIKRTIAAMSYAKLNRFHWHITDSQSFPYISKAYPEMAAHGAYSDHETYTQDDIRDVTAFAKLNGIQVIPEIDAPAHAGNGWDWGPKRGLGDLSLCINQQPWSFYCGEPPCGQLNPKNNNTYHILQKLYEELLNLTGPTDIFHLGGDEVNLECWGQYFNDTDLRGLWCDFMLKAAAGLKTANNNKWPKLIAVWSSGLTNTKCLPKSRYAVQLWGASQWQENYDVIDNGFNVIFSHVDAWYLDCGFGNWRSTGEGACSPYRTWQTIYKHRPWVIMRLDKGRRKQVLGGEVCLWTELVDENQLDNRLWPRSAALGERLWSDPEDEHDLDQDVFKRMSVFRNRLVELGIKAEPIFPKYCSQNPFECI